MMDKKTYETETSLRIKAGIDPDRYYDEIVEKIRNEETIPFEEIFYFLQNPVIEKIEEGSMEEKLLLSRYFLSKDHTELEVHNMTMLPMKTVIEIKTSL